MAWNTENQPAPEQKTFVTCNGNKYDITSLSGMGLVEKLKAVARENGIAKFDVYDSGNKNLTPSEIEFGDFSGDLSLVRFNAAA